MPKRADAVPLGVGSFISFVSSVSSILLAVLTSVLQARVLGPAGKGHVTQVITLSGGAMFFAALSLGGSITHFAAKQVGRPEAFVGIGLVFGSLLSVVSAGILWLVTPWLGVSFFQSPEAAWIYAPVILVPLLLFTTIGNGLLLGLHKIAWSAALELVRTSGFLFFLALFFLGWGWRSEAAGVWAYGVASAAPVLVLGLLLARWGLFEHTEFPGRLAVSVLGFGAKWYITSLLVFLNYRVQIFLLSRYATASEVGIYSVALFMVEWLWVIPNAVSYVLYPAVSASSSEESSRLTSKACRHVVFWTLVGWVLVAALSRPVVRILFGERFIQAVLPTLFLAPGAAAYCLWKILSSDLVGRGRPQYDVLAQSLACAVNLVLGLAMIPRHPLFGAAIAASTGYSLATVVILVCFLRVARVRLLELLVPKREDFRDYGRLWTGLKGLWVYRLWAR